MKYHELLVTLVCVLTPTCVLAQDDSPAKMAEVFDHIRVNVTDHIVEFDGFVAIDCHHPQTPDVYLEVIACALDSREHESLVATRARPSHLHAALLAAGLKPGAPGGWKDSMPFAPSGQSVHIEFIVPTHPDLPTDPRAWIKSNNPEHKDQSLLAWDAAQDPPSSWMFAGSLMVERSLEGAPKREVYAADGTGQIIGLHTFGTEVIAWSRIWSPDAGTLEPEWLADAAVVPPVRTPVVVRISLVEPAADPTIESEASAPSSDHPRREP